MVRAKNSDGDILSRYEAKIEDAGAGIVEAGGHRMFLGEYPETYEKFQRRFGVNDLVMIEFWSSGGVKAAGVDNSEIIRAMKAAGWRGQNIKDSYTTIYLYKNGPRTGETFTLHRDSPDEPGFNLCAPPIFLPDSAGAGHLSQHAIEAGDQFLSSLLADMAELREEISAAMAGVAR